MEDGALNEITNMLMDIEKVSFTEHFMFRFGRRKLVKIPNKERLLLGEVIEYCRSPETSEILKFTIRDKTLYHKYDVYYVVSNRGKIITTWTRPKHLSVEDLLRGKEYIYERANETPSHRAEREAKRRKWLNGEREEECM
jgi:hypothetical protein